MNLLVMTYRLPWHSYTADRNTMLHFIQHFSKRHKITLMAFSDSAEEAAQAEVIRPYCHRIETVVLPKWQSYAQMVRGIVSSDPLATWMYRSSALHERVGRVLAEENIDLAYVYHLRMGQYLADHPEIPRCIALQPAQILNLRRFRDHARGPFWTWFYTLEHERTCRYEPELARKFDRCLLISEKDRQAIDPEGSLTNVFFNPHGLDPDYYAPDVTVEKEPNSVIFHGSMRYQANADAVVYFAEQILPLVRQRIPRVKLYVVGYEPPSAVQALARDPNVVVTGFVEDTREYLKRAQVSIDPLRIGAGLQNKVLEGMSMGLPVVATTIANEGIEAAPEREILIADEPQPFADQVIRLLEDAALRERVGANARAFIERAWSWEAHYAPLETLMNEMVAERRGGVEPVGVDGRTGTR